MTRSPIDSSVPACMGGWCAKRGHCQHYHAADRHEPSERLCAPGFDGIGLDRPVVIHRPVGTWEAESKGLPIQAEVLL